MFDVLATSFSLLPYPSKTLNHTDKKFHVFNTNFNEVFEIHTDASDRQLGAVISQNGKPLRTTQYCRDPQGVQEHPIGTKNQSLHRS